MSLEFDEVLCKSPQRDPNLCNGSWLQAWRLLWGLRGAGRGRCERRILRGWRWGPMQDTMVKSPPQPLPLPLGPSCFSPQSFRRQVQDAAALI